MYVSAIVILLGLAGRTANASRKHHYLTLDLRVSPLVRLHGVAVNGVDQHPLLPRTVRPVRAVARPKLQMHVARVPVVLLARHGICMSRERGAAGALGWRELRRTFMIGCGDAKSNTLTQTATRATGVKAQPNAKRQAVVRTVDRELGERALGRLVPPIHPGEHDVVRLAVEVACAGAGGPGLELLKVPVK